MTNLNLPTVTELLEQLFPGYKAGILSDQEFNLRRLKERSDFRFTTEDPLGRTVPEFPPGSLLLLQQLEGLK